MLSFQTMRVLAAATNTLMTILFYTSDWFSRLCHFLRIKTSDLMVNVFRILTTHVVMTNVLAPLSHHRHPMQNFSLHLIEWLSLSPTSTFATAAGQIVSNKTMALFITLVMLVCDARPHIMHHTCRHGDAVVTRSGDETARKVLGGVCHFSFNTYCSNP